MKTLLTDTNGSENSQNGTPSEEVQLKQNTTQGSSTSSNNVSMDKFTVC